MAKQALSHLRKDFAPVFSCPPFPSTGDLKDPLQPVLASGELRLGSIAGGSDDSTMLEPAEGGEMK